MEELPSKKEKIKAAFTTFLVEYDKGLRLLQDDAKAVSLYTITKVKDMRDRRRQRQPPSPGIADMVFDVNPGAGSEVLSHFKFQWGAIHQDTIATSDCVDVLYLDLQKIFQSVNNSHKIITLAHEELSGLPKIIQGLEDTNAKVESIGKLMREVEADMKEYIKTSTQLEQERKKHSLALQFQKFKEEKENEVKKWEVVVANEKQLAIEKQEEIEMAARKERQEALESMFRQQMAEYKEKGEVEKPILSEEQVKERTKSEVSVEGIEIKDEDGNEALKDFLEEVNEDNKEGDDDAINKEDQVTEEQQEEH